MREKATYSSAISSSSSPGLKDSSKETRKQSPRSDYWPSQDAVYHFHAEAATHHFHHLTRRCRCPPPWSCPQPSSSPGRHHAGLRPSRCTHHFCPSCPGSTMHSQQNMPNILRKEAAHTGLVVSRIIHSIKVKEYHSQSHRAWDLCKVPQTQNVPFTET